MTREELARLLQEQPVRRLHALGKGRIHRHFRLGRQRLIHMLLSLPPDQYASLSADLQGLIHQDQPRPSSRQTPRGADAPPPSSRPATKPASGSSSSMPPEPPTSVGTLLEGIGIPLPSSFTPDPWQVEAIDQLSSSDVIVSVPTGSGKTYVAVEATRQAIEADRTVIYTSPLKALSNTKLTEFSQIFGADRVGILTGDRRENPQAPVLIMTTEILRNLLYDATSGEIDMRLDTLGLVIMDESQYLADPERGVVWEETIIFCPTQARLLLLSASIGNPQEIADWMNSIRTTPCHLIHHRNRSVPLRGGYIHPNKKFTPLFRTPEIVQGRGYSLHPETKRLFAYYEDETLGFRYRR